MRCTPRGGSGALIAVRILAGQVAPSASSVAFFLSLASSAYLAHFNAPLMYAETRPDRHGSRLAPFRAAAAIAFSAAAALFISIGGAGFATFGEAVQALVINNYAAADPLAAIARCGSLPPLECVSARAQECSLPTSPTRVNNSSTPLPFFSALHPLSDAASS